MDLRGVDPKQLKKLADKLDISVDDLLSLSLDELAARAIQRSNHEGMELSDGDLAKVAGGALYALDPDIDPEVINFLTNRRF